MRRGLLRWRFRLMVRRWQAAVTTVRSLLWDVSPGAAPLTHAADFDGDGSVDFLDFSAIRGSVRAELGRCGI